MFHVLGISVSYSGSTKGKFTAGFIQKQRGFPQLISLSFLHVDHSNLEPKLMEIVTHLLGFHRQLFISELS